MPECKKTQFTWNSIILIKNECPTVLHDIHCTLTSDYHATKILSCTWSLRRKRNTGQSSVQHKHFFYISTLLLPDESTHKFFITTMISTWILETDISTVRSFWSNKNCSSWRKSDNFYLKGWDLNMRMKWNID